MAAQITGGIAGVMAANAMFDVPVIEISQTARSGGHLWLAEGIATLGLLLVIFGIVRSRRSSVVAFAVGGYIAAAYYFTSSTSFANPAVTIARMLTDTFAGIEPGSVPGFLAAQLAGTAIAAGLIHLLYPTIGEVADHVVLPHEPARRAAAP